jgi:hypothetical protein
MSKTTPALEWTAEEIIDLVQKRLEPYQPDGDTLNVLPDITHQEGRWWYVIVNPDRSGLSAIDYNARVEKVERDLKRLDNANVIVLPDVPDWMHKPQ